MFDLDQYRAARARAVTAGREDRTVIALEGADRLSFLHSLLSNDIDRLPPGSGCYAAYLTPQGRMISDMSVLNAGDPVLLDVPSASKATLLSRLDRSLFSEDVRLSDRTDSLAIIGVYGPKAADAFGVEEGCQSIGPELLAMDEHDNRRLSVAGVELLVARSNECGVPGFEMYVDRARAAGVRKAMIAADVLEVGAEVLEVLRVENGRPRWGLDMDEETIPLEAGIEGRAISFTKGCYVGQEVIVRILHRGHGRVARRFVGLRVAADEPASRGDAIRSGDKDIGRVTSAALSPLAGSIALGYVQRDFVAPGTQLSIVRGSQPVAAVVADLPFVKP